MQCASLFVGVSYFDFPLICCFFCDGGDCRPGFAEDVFPSGASHPLVDF